MSIIATILVFSLLTPFFYFSDANRDMKNAAKKALLYSFGFLIAFSLGFSK